MYLLKILPIHAPFLSFPSYFFSILFSFGQHIIISYQVQGLFQTLVLSIIALNLCTYVKKIQYYRIVTVTYIHTLRDIISDKGELGSEW